MSEIQNTQNNMDKALARITSVEPYHCNPFDNPPELRRRAERLLKEIESLQRKKKLWKNFSERIISLRFRD